jgi:tetratricopeptide (TPR) repeat protein
LFAGKPPSPVPGCPFLDHALNIFSGVWCYYSFLFSPRNTIVDFNKVIELDPKNGKAYNNRAVAYWHKGELQKARADAQKAQSFGISVNPDFLKKIQEQPPATQ